MKMLPTAQAPGFYRHRIGEIVVTALNDGVLVETTGVLRGIAPKAAAAMLENAFRPAALTLTINAFLVQSGGMTVLIDTGCAGKMGPGAGHLAANLAAAGVAPEDVDLVLLTHLHPDHVNGLLTASGEAAFAHARVMAHAADAAVFLSEAVAANVPDEAKPVFAMARAAIAPYGDRFSTFNDGEVAPGIAAVPLPGHSPGHCGFRIADGGQTLLIWGDVVHVPDLQAELPDIGMVFDADADLAIATRRRAFADAAATRELVAGMHLLFPGFAHVAVSGEGYRLVPPMWSPALD
jgi:glyoxylase-like metal-dependent hydrolase (beta-lactamase superfamily II)